MLRGKQGQRLVENALGAEGGKKFANAHTYRIDADKETEELLISPTKKLIYENYRSNWFELSFVNSTNGTESIMNHTHYLVTRAQRNKLFMPWMVYDETAIEKDLKIVVQNRTDFFNDVYEIVTHGGNATYTCPPGYVFEDSKNISQIAYCNNGTWRVDFNVTKACKGNFIPNFIKD